jgi:HEAT repeat protein
LGRKSTEQRVAAINGLKEADDPRMAEKLARFVADKDKAVRDAAAQAISELRERAKAEEEAAATDTNDHGD